MVHWKESKSVTNKFLRRVTTLQSVDQARNVVLEVNDLQLFVQVYFIEVGKVETSYIEIYNHLANEFGRL